MSDTAAEDSERLSGAPWRKKWIVMALCFAVVAGGLGWAIQREPLNEQEHRLVGMWEWEDSMGDPGTMVLYFSPNGRMIADSAPFPYPQVQRWQIENGEITLIASGPKLIHRIGRLLDVQKIVYPIRFEDEEVIMNMPDGEERRLIRYDAPVPESFSALE